jgi:hypothetical protein
LLEVAEGCSTIERAESSSRAGIEPLLMLIGREQMAEGAVVAREIYSLADVLNNVYPGKRRSNGSLRSRINRGAIATGLWVHREGRPPRRAT